MSQLSTNLPFNQMITKWASALNPILAIPMLSGVQLTDQSLNSGSNVINHKLGRTQQGWILTDIDSNVTVYRSESFNDKTLTLTASGSAKVNIWVF